MFCVVYVSLRETYVHVILIALHNFRLEKITTFIIIKKLVSRQCIAPLENKWLLI